MSNQSIYDITQGTKEIIKRIVSIPNDFVLVGVAGGSASGKGYLINQIAKHLDSVTISMDDYYKGTDDPETNFDHPDALDLDILASHIADLSKGKSIDKPMYDFATHQRYDYEKFTPHKVMFLDGLFGLSKIFVNSLHLSVFVESPEDIRFKRRMERDIAERGRTKECVTKQWHATVQPMYTQHIEPQKVSADIVIENH